MEIVDKLSRESIFYYMFVCIFMLYAFSKMKIGLNIVFGSIVTMIVLTFLYKNNTDETEEFIQTENRKLKLIHPKLISDDHNEMTDFFFSIQDFYVYNPSSYSNCISEVNMFFALYNEVSDDNSLAGINFQLMKLRKMNAINNLNEITYSLNPNVEYDKKLSNAINNLEILLNYHLMHIFKIYKEYNYKHGITTRTLFIDKNELDTYTACKDTIFSTVI